MELPFVSVIIPAYNEEKYIAKCLEEWVNQDYPKNKYEILVYDGMSTDKTAEIIQEFERNYPNLVFYRKNSKRRQVYAFNMGIREARGEFFIIFGAHAYPERDFLKKSIETFLEVKKKELRLAGVGGKIIKLFENRLAKFIALIYSSPLSGASTFWYEEEPHFATTVAFALYDKAVAQEVGGFDEDMLTGNDFEFNLRINKRGYKLFFNPEIKSYYFARSSWKGFLKQSFNYGAVKGVAIRKGYFSLLWLFPFGFLGFEILLLFVSQLLWLFALYWVILFGEGVRLAYKTKNPDGIFLPLLMFIFHNLISFGFIAGLLFHKRAFR
ncbi:glycosyltransferase family 2 protein [Thermococcus alcaliphilus]|uniref:glycosyltransferase family 2 protein n=1 Tax=Thermococcus alcaliphilus TaxID=139207 RepID=UPI00209004DD|nr:glycosyltransferase family 2 protein [Thermococcus alcaliphilus]MCO6042272.1 glycosyltransferase family 2 protein [Thermococcus alcaliphilus]